MVFQDFRLLDHLSAFDNVALPLRLAGKRDGDYAHDVEELLSWVGLGDRMQRQPATLSGGEQQRVAIARAVVARPDLLIADEPTGNVDPEMGARLIRLFGELNRLGTTVLIATHDRALIEATRAREMRLVDGRLVELRTPASAHERHETRSIAILPRDKGAAPLDFVIAVMAFLAALALGASLIADRAAAGLAAAAWPTKLTVQILPPDNGDAKPVLDARNRRGAAICCAPRPASPMPRRCRTRRLDALVAPWIGTERPDRRHSRCRA